MKEFYQKRLKEANDDAQGLRQDTCLSSQGEGGVKEDVTYQEVIHDHDIKFFSYRNKKYKIKMS